MSSFLSFSNLPACLRRDHSLFEEGSDIPLFAPLLELLTLAYLNLNTESQLPARHMGLQITPPSSPRSPSPNMELDFAPGLLEHSP